MPGSILTIPAPPPQARDAYGPDPQHFGYLYLPETPGPHATVIFLHGGFWRAQYDLNHAGHLCHALAQAGLAVWSVEYRRIGHPTGGWPNTGADVVLGARHLANLAKKYPLDTNRVLAMGHSAGGHLALWLASQRAVTLRGVVALAAVTDLRRAYELKLSNQVVAALMGGSPDERPAEYHHASPIELLPSKQRVRLLHGSNDQIVPVEFSERYAHAAQSVHDDCTAEVLPRGDHFCLIDPQARQFARVTATALALLA